MFLNFRFFIWKGLRGGPVSQKYESNSLNDTDKKIQMEDGLHFSEKFIDQRGYIHYQFPVFKLRLSITVR